MRYWSVLLLGLLLCAVGNVSARQPGEPAPPSGVRPQVHPPTATADLLVYRLWVTPLEGTVGQAAAYMTIDNQTDQTYRLIDVQSPISDPTEFQKLTPEGEPLSLADGVELPPHTKTVLAPDSYRILMTLTSPDPLPEAIPLTLALSASDDTLIAQTAAALVVESPPERINFVVVGAFATLAPPLEVEGGIEARLTPTPQVEPDSIALYGQIVNIDTPSASLIGARLNIAPHVEVRESYLAEGAVASRVIPFIGVPILARLRLQPNGYYLRASGVTDMPAPGDAFAAVLLFDTDVEVPTAFIMESQP